MANFLFYKLSWCQNVFFHKSHFPYYQKTLQKNRLNWRCQFVHTYLLPLFVCWSYIRKLFWNNQRTVCSRLVILSYFASCILSSKPCVCVHYFLTFEHFWWSLLKLPTSHRRLRTSHRWPQTSHRQATDNYRWVTDDYRRVTDNYRWIPDKFSWAPDYYSQQEPRRCIFSH